MLFESKNKQNTLILFNFLFIMLNDCSIKAYTFVLQKRFLRKENFFVNF